jgi:hypothetical protein
MPQSIVYLDKEEDDKVKEYSVKWSLSKAETIKKIVRDYEE